MPVTPHGRRRTASKLAHTCSIRSYSVGSRWMLEGLEPAWINRTANEALPQTDEACGACGWFVSFLVGLRQGLVKLEIFLEATLA